MLIEVLNLQAIVQEFTLNNGVLRKTTGYQGIVDAALDAAGRLRGGADA